MSLSNVTNVLALGATLAGLLFLGRRKLRDSAEWRATVTPLASIIGSGFLIVAPLLHAVLGKWALAGMVALIAISYAMGAVLRFNIAHAEVYVEDNPKSAVARVETVAQWALGLAYAISVAFYANLLVAFVCARVSISDPTATKSATTMLLLTLMVIAWKRGSRGLETIELVAVTVKLAIIAGVLIALTAFDVATGTQWFQHGPTVPVTGWDTAAMVAGMLMVTQGFETTRFMGAHYSTGTRVRASRRAQWISGVIYIAFIGITCPLFLEFPVTILNETAVSTTLGQVATVLPSLLLVAALASQLSAALADTVGGGGLLHERVPIKARVNVFYMLITALAVILTWSADVFELITIASKGFGVFYLLQVIVAALIVAKNAEHRRGAKLIVLGLLAGILVFVVVASIPPPHA